MRGSLLPCGWAPVLQLSYLVLVALQSQPLNSSLKVPDPNGKVIGRRGKYVGCQWVETQRVYLLCVACRGGSG